jgi:perosamine synthetase
LNEELRERVVAAVEAVVGAAARPVLLHQPMLPSDAWTDVKACLDSGWVSSAGAAVAQFEEKLAGVAGVRRAVAVVNGTAALQMCLHAAGVEPNDEVICPSLSFVATANAIAHCGAVPHFVDVDRQRLALAPESLRQELHNCTERRNGKLVNRKTGRPIGAVVLIHCFGHPGAIDEAKAVCQEFDLPLIEDAAESLGSWYKGRHTGGFGLLSAVSFNGNKIVTTGGGGAVLTNDDELANRVKHLTTTAKVAHPWEFEHDAVGWNYRMPNLNAALGLSQLAMLPELVAAKRRLAARYEDAFSKVEGVEFLREPADSVSNYWLNTICLQRADWDERNAVLEGLNQAGFQARPVWRPLHTLPMYRECPRGDLSVTEDLAARLINLPSSPCLGWDIGEHA